MGRHPASPQWAVSTILRQLAVAVVAGEPSRVVAVQRVVALFLDPLRCGPLVSLADAARELNSSIAGQFTLQQKLLLIETMEVRAMRA